MKVPSFLLRRLYVPGSLANTPDGWRFALRNTIAAGEATELDPLAVDGEAVDPGQCAFSVDGDPVPFTEVGEDRPFGLESGRDVEITVAGEPLPPGEHTIRMGFRVAVIGHLSFEFTDEPR